MNLGAYKNGKDGDTNHHQLPDEEGLLMPADVRF
jgi:hypothetical protein